MLLLLNYPLVLTYNIIVSSFEFIHRLMIASSSQFERGNNSALKYLHTHSHSLTENYIFLKHVNHLIANSYTIWIYLNLMCVHWAQRKETIRLHNRFSYSYIVLAPISRTLYKNKAKMQMSYCQLWKYRRNVHQKNWKWFQLRCFSVELCSSCCSFICLPDCSQHIVSKTLNIHTRA